MKTLTFLFLTLTACSLMGCGSTLANHPDLEHPSCFSDGTTVGNTAGTLHCMSLPHESTRYRWAQ